MSPGVRTGPLPRHAWPVLVAVLFVLSVVGLRWDVHTGFTSLLRFGDSFAAQRIPELSGLPVRTYPGIGYDGQFYSQLAVDPDVRRPEVQAALDNPRYRARRLLLPAMVHLAGAGNAWLTLQLFALVNVLVWLALGWLLWRRVGSQGWQGTGIWLACMLGMGALDCIRLALTDLPAMLLVFLAVEAVERGRQLPALSALIAAVLVRDTSLLAATVAGSGNLRTSAAWRRYFLTGVIVALPFIVWSYWLLRTIPAGNTLGTGHFTWPGSAIITQFTNCSQAILHGDFDSRFTFGLLAALSFTWQALFVLQRFSWEPAPWLRIALPFALFVFVVGDPVWKGYWAVARTFLPLTFAYNLLLPRDRRFWSLLLIGNICTFHAIYRILPD